MPSKLNDEGNHIPYLLMDIVRGIEQMENFVSRTVPLCGHFFQYFCTTTIFSTQEVYKSNNKNNAVKAINLITLKNSKT